MCAASQIQDGGGDPARRDHGRVNRPWLLTGFAVALNAFTLLGVLVWGWPPGNVYLLFWLENAVLGVATIPRIVSARRSGPQATINNRPASPGALAAFFVLHYGIFCLVHAGFTGVVAYGAGVRLSFAYLGLPALLILVRYAVETAFGWFGPGGQRWVVSPSQAATQPYPRIVVLHLAVLVAFGLSVARVTHGSRDDWYRYVEYIVTLLPPQLASPGVFAVVILLLIKSVVDVITTRRWANVKVGVGS